MDCIGFCTNTSFFGNVLENGKDNRLKKEDDGNKSSDSTISPTGVKTT
jgi:hypothetical protein